MSCKSLSSFILLVIKYFVSTADSDRDLLLAILSDTAMFTSHVLL